jgi:hypothetical protein
LNDFLRDDTLLRVDNNDPWFADIVKFMASGYVPLGGEKRKLIYESRLHMWDEPYPFHICADSLLRRCIPSWEVNDILEMCHSSPMRKFGSVVLIGPLCTKMPRIS